MQYNHDERHTNWTWYVAMSLHSCVLKYFLLIWGGETWNQRMIFLGGDIYAQIMSVREADVSVRHTDRIYCIYIYNYFSFSFFVNIKYRSFQQKSQFSFGLYQGWLYQSCLWIELVKTFKKIIYNNIYVTYYYLWKEVNVLYLVHFILLLVLL